MTSRASKYIDQISKLQRCSVCRAIERKPEIAEDLKEWIRLVKDDKTGDASWSGFCLFLSKEHGMRTKPETWARHITTCLGEDYR